MLARTERRELETIPASFPSGPRWYAFYARPRAEERAGEELQELGFETFVPIDSRNKRPGALFRRYGFVRFDINHPWGEIIEVKSVVDLVRVNEIPRAIPDAVIGRIQDLVRIGAFSGRRPEPGTSVEIADPSWAEHIGHIAEVRSAKQSAKFIDVLIEMFGSKRVVRAPWDKLRKI